MLQARPLEITDFSGGITENVLGGDPRRYARADNFLITVDKMLTMRDGFVIDGSTSYQVTGATGQRINGYYSLQNESVLIPQVSRNLYYKDSSAWSRIAGVGGRETLSGGSEYSQTTYFEFQKLAYFATDGDEASNGALPSKIFKDTSNAWTVRTVGLPRSFVLGNYTDSSLLAKCIANANIIRATFILHMEDAVYSTYQDPTAYETTAANLHLNIDRYSLCYLKSESFGADTNIPDPLPTPQGACTNQATLFLLVAALNSAYTAHVADGMVNSWGTHLDSTTATAITHPRYHQDPPVYDYKYYYTAAPNAPFQKTKGPGAPLNATGTPTTLLQAAAMLDDLWQKWTWHSLAVNTHHKDNTYDSINIYPLNGSKIGTIQTGSSAFPTVTSNWTDILNYVNNLLQTYNYHVVNLPGVAGTNVAHIQRDNNRYDMQLECTLPEATDLDRAYLLIWWLRSLYQLHYFDAAQPNFKLVGFDGTSGSADLVNVAFAGGGAVSQSLGMFLYLVPASSPATQMSVITDTYDFQGGSYHCAKVTANGAGTATIDHTIDDTNTSYDAILSGSMYHICNDASGVPANSLVSLENDADNLSSSVTTYGTDLSSWLALANDLFFALANHIRRPELHVTTTPSVLQAENTYQYLIQSVPHKNFFIPEVASVSYALFFSDEYTVEPNGIDYLIQGNPVLSDSMDAAISNPSGSVLTNLYPNYYTARPILTTRSNVLTNLPVLVNDAATNYATTNVKLNIYRTTNGGQTYFLLDQVDNGTTTYTDSTNDTLDGSSNTALDTHTKLYTTGGVVGFDQPPICKFTHMLNTTAYWGGVTESGQFFPNRLRQSLQNAPDAAPADFTDDYDSPIMGISSTRSNPIVFCQGSIYRLSGGFNLQGQGQLIHENISDTLGCLNAKSIVKTEVGVFFAGDDGFYYTDGYQVILISLELKKTYARLTQTAAQRKRIYGAYNRLTRQIWWAMSEDPSGADNSVVYVFYLDYGIKPSGVFTLLRNNLNFKPSSLVFQAGTAYYAHGDGYLFKSDPDTKWDALIDSSVAGSLWQHGSIPYNYTSLALDCGTTFARKWITKFHLVGENTGNVAMQPYAVRDLNQSGQGPKAMAPINYQGNCVWGNPTFVWGDDSFLWNPGGKMDVWRRFPSSALRADHMQLELVPADLAVYASSVNYPDGAFVTVNATTKLITLLTPSSYTSLVFPLDVVGYSIKLATDNYVNEYAITAIDATNKILTVTGTDNTLTTVVSPGVKWEIWGTKKEQRPTISSLVIHYAYIGDKNEAYPGATSDSGQGNAGQNP